MNGCIGNVTNNCVRSSLVKEGKASVEREQALKFVRAFLDVKDGVEEISPAVVRTIVSVAEYSEDRLRLICIETLGEISKCLIIVRRLTITKSYDSDTRPSFISRCRWYRVFDRCPR